MPPKPVQREQRSRGVWLGQSNDHGIKDIWTPRSTGLPILGLLGDTCSKDLRLAKAVGILAQPQRALDLFDQGAQLTTTPATDPADSADATDTDQLRQSPSGRRGVDPRPRRPCSRCNGWYVAASHGRSTSGPSATETTRRCTPPSCSGTRSCGGTSPRSVASVLGSLRGLLTLTHRGCCGFSAHGSAMPGSRS